MTIELRLTDVDPPAAEPARTIYRDIVNLPDPTTLGITIRYFNYDDVGLYMQITGSGTGYTFTPVNLGLLASGTNTYKNLDNFASRAKPTVAQLPNGEMSENITLTLKGYSDAGYTTLKWTFDRVVTVIWINSADAAFTVDVLNDFDDGTVQGWAYQCLSGCNADAIIEVVTDYVLSPPYSVRGKLNTIIGAGAFLGIYAKCFYLKKAADALIFLGTSLDANANIYVPMGKWMRIVVPLPTNTTLEIRLQYAFMCQVSAGAYWYGGEFYIYKSFTTPNKTAVYAIADVRLGEPANHVHGYLWLDDFKIISK